MKKFFTILFSLAVVQSFSQDLIILNTGEEIKAKILEIDEIYIRYRLFDDLNAKIQLAALNEVMLVKYFDGTTVVFDTESKFSNDTTYVPVNDNELRILAVNDAQVYYNPTLPVLLAGCSSCCLPGVGVFTAFYPANIKNYNLPPEYANNNEYVRYYGEEVNRIKQKKVLITTAISSTASLMIILLFLLSI